MLPTNWATFARIFVTENFKNCQIWSHWLWERMSMVGQCEQTARLLFQYLAIYNNKILPNWTKNWQSTLGFCQINPHKMPKSHNFSGKVAKQLLLLP